MNEQRRTPQDLTNVDDQTLGAALGDAIRDQVDAPAARPPVTHIAERAAAQAKARNARRAVMSIAASIALVAGGIAAWNALDDDQTNEIIVVNQPTGAPEADPVSVPTVGPTPAPTASQVGEQPEVAEDAPEVPAEVISEPTVPQTTSTDPAIEWVGLDTAAVFGTGVADAHNAVSVGDGRVLVQAYGDDGSQVLLSDNGTDWTVLSMPSDFTPNRFDIAGDRWLVTGWDAYGLDGTIRAFYSDDQGAAWTELGLNINAPDQTSSVASAMVSGRNMVIVVERRIHPDIASVIVGRGLAPDKDSIKGWVGMENNTVTFALDESAAPQSFELTVEEQDLLYGGERSFVNLYYSSGGTPELVAEFPAWETAGYSADDGFYLSMLTTGEEKLLTSPDGRQWTQAALTTDDGTPVGRFYAYYDSSEGTVWTSGQSSSRYRVERSSGVYTTPLVAELPDGVSRVDRMSAGPAGISMVAVAGNLPDADLMPTFQVAKEGYELRYNQPEGGISLWDLAEDAAVYEFYVANAQSAMLPEGVREVEGAGEDPDLLVFEDPETGEHLVTFTMEELDPWIANPLFFAETNLLPEQLDRWIGWSGDGITWQWRTVSDAFGLTELTDVEKEFTNVELAVGHSFVIARVQTFQADPTGASSEDGIMLSGGPARWFIATIQ